MAALQSLHLCVAAGRPPQAFAHSEDWRSCGSLSSQACCNSYTCIVSCCFSLHTQDGPDGQLLSHVLAVLTPHQRRRPWLASPEPTCCLMFLFASPAGEASPRPDHVPQAARHRHRAAVREVRRQVRGVRLVCAARDAGARVRRVQLRLLRRALRHLRRHRHLRRLLLQGRGGQYSV